MAEPARKRLGSDPSRLREADEFFDLDVPAAVVCAVCGDADCPGCANELSRSGVVTVVAWERPGGRAMSKLWETAHAATRDCEGFFELLPAGPVAPALGFAFASELVASAAAIALLLGGTAALAPAWARHVVFDPVARDMALRLLASGIPALALLLVVAHGAHALALNAGARKNGAPGDAGRALRFGLYACGWDLVQGPVGAVVVGVKRGLGAWLQLHTSSVPTRASLAFLRGCYRLVGRPADRALGTSYVGAAVVTLVSAVAIVAALLVGAIILH